VYFYFIVLKLRKQMGEELAVEILADLVGNTPVPGPACPVCGKEMRYKGMG
jgi:DNA repair exonuclease SbcCD ATPase subunit